MRMTALTVGAAILLAGCSGTSGSGSDAEYRAEIEEYIQCYSHTGGWIMPTTRAGCYRPGLRVVSAEEAARLLDEIAGREPRDHVIVECFLPERIDYMTGKELRPETQIIPRIGCLGNGGRIQREVSLD